jgi:hypothetical protein
VKTLMWLGLVLLIACSSEAISIHHKRRLMNVHCQPPWTVVRHNNGETIRHYKRECI